MDAEKIRVRRECVQSEKDSEGRVYVRMGGDASEIKPRPEDEPSGLISAKGQRRKPYPDGEVVQEGSEGRWWRMGA